MDFYWIENKQHLYRPNAYVCKIHLFFSVQGKVTGFIFLSLERATIQNVGPHIHHSLKDITQKARSKTIFVLHSDLFNNSMSLTT